MAWISYLNSHDKLNIWEWFLESDFFFFFNSALNTPGCSLFPCFCGCGFPRLKCLSLLSVLNESFMYSKTSACVLFLLDPPLGIWLLCPWSHHCYLVYGFYCSISQNSFAPFLWPLSLPLDFEKLRFKDLSDSASPQPYVCWMNKYPLWSLRERTF